MVLKPSFSINKFGLFNSLQFLIMIIACLKFVYIDNLLYATILNYFFPFLFKYFLSTLSYGPIDISNFFVTSQLYLIAHVSLTLLKLFF